MPTSIKDIAWIAGLLEGEGTFVIWNDRYPRIGLHMTDLDIIERAKTLLNPSRSISVVPGKDENHKTSYRVSVDGDRAIQWMMTIYPLMGVRRKAKIREVIEIWKNLQYVGRGWATRHIVKRLQKMGYTDTQIEIAKILKSGKLSDEQIIERLKIIH